MSLIKIILISFLFCYSLNFDYLNLDLQLRDNNPSNDDTILNRLVESIMEELMEVALKINILPDVSFRCQKTLNKTFFNLDKNSTDKEDYSAYYYFSKLILDSSTNVNDLSSYSNCMHRNHQYNFTTREPLKPVYLTVYADYREFLLDFFKTGNRTTTYLVGVCFVQNCNEEDHEIIISKIMKYIGLIKENDEHFNLKVYSLNKEDYKPGWFKVFIKFIPLYIITIHLFIVFFHKYIGYLFKKIKNKFCEKNKKRKIIPRIYNTIDDTDISPTVSFTKSYSSSTRTNLVKPHQNFRNYIKALFNIENNFDFLIKRDDRNEIHNDSSLSYMNGIKGISMITIIFGFVFINLYNSPITRQNAINFYDNMTSLFFFIFYFGIKYAPKLLLCSSGFSLFYKFMCFLDDKLEAEKTIKKIQEEEMNKDNNVPNIDTSHKNNDFNHSTHSNCSSSYYSTSSDQSRKMKNKVELSSKYYFIFIASQIHKYILYLLILFFILFSLFDFGLLFIDLGPMWNFFNKNAIDSSYKLTSILPSIFCFQGYFFNSLEKDSILNYFYLVYQEVIYFIISTLVIFLGYKYDLSIDRFIIGTIIILWLSRLLYNKFNDDLNVKEYFSFYGYFLFYNSLIYNYAYYLVGIYFGCLNYVIQKRYNCYECDKNHKKYLVRFTRLLKTIKQESKLLYYILGIIFLIIIIVLTFDQYILFKYNKSINKYDNDNMKKIPELLNFYNNNAFINVIMSVDTDVVVVLVNLMALFFYLKGDNFIDDFLHLHFWGIFNKIYFSFILLINPVILYVFYITESRINFNMQNCYLYSFACGILVFSLVILVYAIFELPYKKIIRLYLKRNEIKVGQKALGYMENSNNSLIYKQMEIKGDLVESKGDSGSIGDDNDNDANNEDYSEIKLEEKFIENENQNEKE